MITFFQVLWVVGATFIISAMIFTGEKFMAAIVLLMLFSGWVVWFKSAPQHKHDDLPVFERQHTVLIMNGKHMEF